MTKLVVANWKANKVDLVKWFDEFSSFDQSQISAEVSLAPQTPLLTLAGKLLTDYKLQNFGLAAQDVSLYASGAYTGEVTAGLLHEVGVKYVLVGHSERRRNFKETNEIVGQKVSQAQMTGLIPIICVQSESEIPSGVWENGNGLQEHEIFVMYEPETAISTPGNYHPEDPKRVEEVILHLKDKFKTGVFYGGSVNSQNVSDYHVADGFVVGQASLDPKTFYELLCQIKT